MRLPVLALALGSTALAANAEGFRDLDSHVHGVGQFRMAIEGAEVVIGFEAPGADIVGFEHAAESDEDRARIEDAIAVLARPSDLFALPGDAGCVVTEARAELLIEGEDDHDDHGHADEHDHDHEHDHEEADAHEEHDHDEHSHDEADAHEEHGHGESEEHAGHEHDHDHEGSHSAFRAEYALTCDSTGAIEMIAFPYFDRFPNAEELEVQIVTEGGAGAYEVSREVPELDLRGLF